jgi:hypothetical protein
MSFKEAISLRIISDYKILTIAVSDQEVKDLIARNRLLNLHDDLDEAEARAVATGMALKRIYRNYGAKHAISFHASIRAADRFREQQDILNCLKPHVANFHISGYKTAGERKLLLDEFKAAPRALMTNARCLTEGIDVPAIDCVVFADPKQSTTDVVQAAGRVMRRAPGKEYGYIVVPIVVPEDMEFAEFVETTAFRTVMRIITALSVHDERIVDELRAIRYGRVSSSKIINIDGKVPIGMRMSLSRFADAISLKMWDKVARVNWQPFKEARAYVRELGFESVEAYRSSAKKPKDIPYNPQHVYAGKGWICWSDWLGNDSHRRGNWRPFEQTRAFAQSLGFKSRSEWDAYGDSGKRPTDIPAKPNKVYTGTGWAGWPDFLASGWRSWRPFGEARAFARSLGLKSTAEWEAYCCSEKRPADIPINPCAVYANAGWIDWSDWLGRWRSFENARAFARGLKFKSLYEWQDYCRSGNRPNDIPANPDRFYADAGWISWPDWLGNGRRYGDDWRPFKEARALARTLGFNYSKEWKTYCHSGKRPSDIPISPGVVYADAGWDGWGDWLGHGRRVGNWRPFEEARSFVQSLGFKSNKAWSAYCRSGKKPEDIPATPSRVYADAGWAGTADWLGHGHRVGNWRPFDKARAFVHRLGFKSQREWFAYSRSGRKPDDIPAAVAAVYANAGWQGWTDWLGYRRGHNWLPFEDARAFAQKLGLGSSADWRAYSSEGKRPKDIPAHPRLIYANAGWNGWGDWLGTGLNRGNGRPFQESRALTRRFRKIRSTTVYREKRL